MNANRIIAFSLVFLVSSLLLAGTVSAQAVRVLVDGDEVAFDQPPIIMGSRVLVPLRGIFEKMGATVDWTASTRTVEAARGNTLVVLKIGSRIARVNDRPVTLDVPAMVVRSRTLVPLRFISESLGANVEWREEARTVLISSPGQPVAQPVWCYPCRRRPTRPDSSWKSAMPPTPSALTTTPPSRGLKLHQVPEVRSVSGQWSRATTRK
ncbi:MAG: copper amine oxidase N-terminal domain-containing protein [bacterium]